MSAGPPTDPPGPPIAPGLPGGDDLPPIYEDEPVIVLPTQRAGIMFDGKWAAMRGGQGSGKTTAWCYFAWDRMEEYPLALATVVGATYGQVRDGYFHNFQSVLWTHGLDEDRDYVFRKVPSPRITIKETGAVLQSWTADAVHRLRGVNIQTLILEEPQTWGPRAEQAWIGINGRLRPNMLTAKLYPDLVPKGRISFNPTDVMPGHWLYELIEGRWPEEGYPCWQLSTRDNTLLLEQDPGYVRNLEISMSPDRHAVEIDGEYPRAGGGIYRNFEPAIHGNPPATIPPVDFVDMTKPLHLSFDFNVDLMSATVSQPYVQKRFSAGWEFPKGKPPFEKFHLIEPTWQRRILRVLGEICIEDGSVQNVVQAFLRPMSQGGWLELAQSKGVVLFGDPSGNNRQQNADAASSSRTNWRTIETMFVRALGRNKVRMEVPDAPPSVDDRLNEVNAQMLVGDGFGGTAPGMTVNVEACPHLCKDFQQVKRAKNGKDIEKTPGTLLTHVSDALGYNVFRIRTLWREADIRKGETPISHMGR